MRVSKIDRIRAAISAAFVLLTVIGATGCDGVTAAIGVTGRTAAHEAEQSALRATIHDVAKDLDSEEARVVLGLPARRWVLPARRNPPPTWTRMK